MKTMSLFLTALLLATVLPCRSQEDTNSHAAQLQTRAPDQRATIGSSKGPICFTNELAAFTNGQTLYTALKSRDPESKKQIQALIDSRVLFDGWAGLGNADLHLGDDISLEVEVSPPREVRPHARNWEAETVGVLKSVDIEKRVIRIEIRPEDWKAYEAR
ncbi:MAG: hypothetical protein ABSC18_04265 [Verrucomicrobiota bacterium]